MDYSKLRGKIKEKFCTQRAFAKAIGMNNVSLSKKLCGKTVWTSDEIYIACKALDISICDNAQYFFAEEVAK